MKRSTEIKYPNSANLFQFCRKVLDHKFGGIRVIDQDVGQILGFDPADCSHWKKGKKNIRSIQAMKAIADHLGVDEKLVIDVASGEVDESEAFLEFNGYGAFSIDLDYIESAKKEYYRKNLGQWTRETETNFKNFFELRNNDINTIVEGILKKVNFQEAPLYLPEIISAYPELEMEAIENSGEKKNHLGCKTIERDGKFVIQYSNNTEMKPFLRFQIARALGEHFLKDLKGEKNDTADYVFDIQKNLFAAKILCPAAIVKKEMKNINISKDIVTQLAETFWVSKSFMNRRLKDILQNSSEI